MKHLFFLFAEKFIKFWMKCLNVHCTSSISITTNNELNLTEQQYQTPEFKNPPALYSCVKILIRYSCCGVDLHSQVVFQSISLALKRMFQLLYLSWKLRTSLISQAFVYKTLVNARSVKGCGTILVSFL